jgi:hypothetical protein
MEAARQNLQALLRAPVLDFSGLSGVLDQLVQEQVGLVAARQIITDMVTAWIDQRQQQPGLALGTGDHCRLLTLILERLKTRTVSFEEQARRGSNRRIDRPRRLAPCAKNWQRCMSSRKTGKKRRAP